jgi:hypothetical protein
MENPKNEPVFLDQAFAIVEESFKDSGKDHGMKIADHKLLCQILNAHEEYIDNKIIDAFVGQISVHYEPIMASQERLEKGIKAISEDIKEIKAWRVETNKRLNVEESKSEEFDRKINTLNKQVTILNPDLIEKFIGVMGEMIESQKPVNIAKRITIAVVISVMVIAIAAILLLPIYHKKVLERSDATPKSQTEQPK